MLLKCIIERVQTLEQQEGKMETGLRGQRLKMEILKTQKTMRNWNEQNWWIPDSKMIGATSAALSTAGK